MVTAQFRRSAVSLCVGADRDGVRWMGGVVRMDVLERARAGDGAAFAALVAPHQQELLVHCYRFLGSLQDAEDALQDALLSAWQGLAGYEGRASVRTWLYRVTTNRCLNMIRSGQRRPRTGALPAGLRPPPPSRLGEVTWLEPCPDDLLAGLPDAAPGPDAQYETRESVSLAFITAVQLLPPRQRAVLILRDVLGFSGQETAGILEATVDSVTSALKRARAAVRADAAFADRTPGDAEAERVLIAKLSDAYATGDVDGLVGLLTEDVWLRMPPVPLEYQGRALAVEFFTAVGFRDGRRYRIVPARANGQPAFGAYRLDPRAGSAHAAGLHVLTVRGDRVSALTRFDNSVLARFGLPLTLPHGQ